MEKTYNVVFTGNLKQGFASEQVEAALQSRLKMSAPRARQIVSASQPVVFKKSLPADRAQSMKTGLEKLGLEIWLDEVPAAPMAPVEKPALADSGLTLVPMDDGPADRADPEPGPDDKPAMPNFECPKCGVGQHKSEICVSCGVVFAKLAESSTLAPGAPPPAPSSTQGAGAHQPAGGNRVRPVVGSDEDSEPSNLKAKLGAGIGVLGVGFILLKKFKLLKVAALLGLAGYGYLFDQLEAETREYCMGNEVCEEQVNDQAGDCWESSGLDQHDWDDMSDDEFYSLYPKLETDFVGCFTAPDGSGLFIQPLVLTGSIMSMCDYDEACMTRAYDQQKSCYEDANLPLYREELIQYYTHDDIDPRLERRIFEFDSCFLDASGEPLFAEYLDPENYYSG